ncbi:MAG: LysR family transcriptional regulator [Pseudonocardiales bacterium]|nr:MAG: LysR family transcriptional regulator [Pseudonocardiales bacterium]
MSLTPWQTFVSVCRLRSLSAAATEAGYTQSAVSRQVGALERIAGVRLLERQARGVTPTDAGEAFLRHALVVVNEAERAIRAAQAARAGFPRPLAVGATPSLAAGAVPAAMRRLLDESGPLAWSLVPGLTPEIHNKVVSGELDIAVVTDAPPGLPDDDRVVREALGTDQMVVIVRRADEAAGRREVRIEELSQQTWAEDNEGSANLLRQHAARAGVTARIDMCAADLPGKVAMVAAGHAIALVPGSLIPALRPDVVAVQLVGAPTRGIFAVLPRHQQHPAALTLVPLLRSAVG